jgi:hypothetical protein
MQANVGGGDMVIIAGLLDMDCAPLTGEKS